MEWKINSVRFFCTHQIKKTAVIKIGIRMVILVMPGIIINMIIIKLNGNENIKKIDRHYIETIIPIRIDFIVD